jgi:cytochrome c oxidase assembly protein subunit 17
MGQTQSTSIQEEKPKFQYDPKTGYPLGEDGKPLKPCCVCPITRKQRDECILREGNEESCIQFIEAHKQCLRDLGFKI